jgi:polyketide biosynthesis acyl carrier protein
MHINRKRKTIMDKDEIFSVIKKNIIDVVPELANRSITMDDSLRKLGANSVDRAEILIKSLEALRLKDPLVEFGQAANLAELVAIFLEKLNSQKK